MNNGDVHAISVDGDVHDFSVPVTLSSVAKSADVIPCVNEKVLMVNSAANEESVVRLAAR